MPSNGRKWNDRKLETLHVIALVYWVYNRLLRAKKVFVTILCGVKLYAYRAEWHNYNINKIAFIQLCYADMQLINLFVIEEQNLIKAIYLLNYMR